MEHNKAITDFQGQINDVSPSFCIAKWKQVTLHLQTGHNHSCHHPVTHKIPLNELAYNPSALHNTQYKKLQRKDMLEGKRPSECDYCWKVEDSAPNALSDRIYKSYDTWARPHLDDIKNMPWDQDVVPSYLEVSFSNACNFKCSYCSPQVSSSWMDEVKRYGPYPTHDKFNDIAGIEHLDQMPIPHNQYNPYVEAFWKWWPTVYKELQHFRVTGGEPLMSKDTFKVLDYVIENPNPEIHLSINSNLCVTPQLFDKFLEKVKIICKEKKVKKFKIFTSCDAHGQAAEYIRNGMDYNLWLSNIRRVLTDIPECTITIMSTYNVLSVPNYLKFQQDVLDIKNEFGGYDKISAPLILDTPYLRYPTHQNVFQVMPAAWSKEYIFDQVTLMYRNLENGEWYGSANRGFFKWEAEKFKRIYELTMHQQDPDHVTVHQKDFVAFVDEHDRRRGTNFLETFPEFEPYYTKWNNAR
jgi:organic radical activating enzyme